MVGQREAPEAVGREHRLVAVRALPAQRWTVERHPGVEDDRVEAVRPERAHGCPERNGIGQVQGVIDVDLYGAGLVVVPPARTGVGRA